ncbi:ankyrin repeat-containing domain protein [Gongronella butleri]|nr:ankyrin repeat-containing domain protein [Gongronella butleri]
MQIVFNKRIGKQRQAINTDHIKDLLQLSPAEVLLLDACARKTAKDVASLLTTNAGINPDAIRDKYLRTPLHIACSRQDNHDEATEIARVLIHAGADVNNGVGDIDGFKPMHLAVLSCNYKCVLLLLEKDADVPATDPFRLTPLLLAKLKLNNLRPSASPDTTEAAKREHAELFSITEVLVKHLANKHITTAATPPRSPISDRLLRKDDTKDSKDDDSDDLSDTITSLADQLSTMAVGDTNCYPPQLRDNLNGLIERIRKLGIQDGAANGTP